MDAITDIARAVVNGSLLMAGAGVIVAIVCWVCWLAAEHRRRQEEAEDRAATGALIREAERIIQMAKAEDLK